MIIFTVSLFGQMDDKSIDQSLNNLDFILSQIHGTAPLDWSKDSTQKNQSLSDAKSISINIAYDGQLKWV